ncbi:hypothetical protein [Psychroflexus maritimus]|uniref:Uncharacterized protein n=1 Tax=Psychroflexus maritimus TaxID=2714865 RepID=A0A967ABQ7_9FLAO|nr:hypothetical protein [Psychroflexus maritimus]NGZ89334.1 hypothetical protein [Psychroflexus maritimus]
MLGLRRITNLVVFIFILATTFSCSDDNEVLEQQDPQSQISTELSQRLVTNTGGNSEEAEEFNDDITWYKSSDIDPSYCGVQGALLAYELFDANNNSLDGILITGWSLESGISIEDTVILLEQIAEQEYGQGVQLIFVAAVLVKPIDADTADVAQVSNYTVFADYFKDCQSSNVIFEEEDNSIDVSSLMPEPDPVDFPDETLPCASLEFPVDIIIADENDAAATSQVTVDEQGLISYLTANVSGLVFIDFVYPVNVNLADGTQVAANSATELEQIFDQNCD